MPGHKGGPGAPPRGVELFGAGLYAIDVSEMGGFDYLHGATSALLRAQADAARIFGAARTFYLVNGATSGNLAALLATASDHDRVLVARGSHRSVYAGLVLSGARPSYLAPVANPALDGLFGIDLDDLERALEDEPSISAVHVTSPSYYGFTIPLDDVRTLTAARGIPLIVDEAHGSHFVFNAAFPRPALGYGADLVVQSPHKTLGSLTQSSLLHVAGTRVNVDRVDQALQMLQSSSPSALLLLSLDLAITEAASSGQAAWGRAIASATTVRAALADATRLHIYGDEIKDAPGIYDFDPTKLVVDVSGLAMTGQESATWLKQHWRINPEFSDLRRIVFSITPGDDERSIELLIDALGALGHTARGSESQALISRWPQASPALAVTPREGFSSSAEPVALDSAIGRVTAEMIVPYPPGIPLLVPGELLTEAVIETLRQLLAAGCRMVGMADPSGSSIRCLPEESRLD
jgi:arginine/lysine/ornithine decarboxylase